MALDPRVREIISGMHVYDDIKIPNTDNLLDTIDNKKEEHHGKELQGPQCRLKVTDKVKKKRSILKLNDISVLSAGNISCVSGQAKSRKTTFVNMLVSAFLNNEYGGFTATDITGAVIWIDTEQSEDDVMYGLKRIYKMSGLTDNYDSDNFQTYRLRSYGREERKEFTELLIKRIKPKLCIIDGIADLMVNSNDLAETADISDMLLRLTSEYDCHIIVVLHTNPGSTKTRGHIGSEIERKAETSFLVTRLDEKSSTVTFPYTRGKTPDSLSFLVNCEGVPELFDYIPPEKRSREDKLKDLFDRLLKHNSSLRHSELMRGIMSNKQVKEVTAKKDIKEALSLGILQKDADGRYNLYSDKEEITKEY